MGYHVELVGSPPRPVLWDDLARAATSLGWVAHAPEQEVRFEPGGTLVARVVLTGGEAWIKSPDDAALAAVIALADRMGLRARGDEFESYRSVEDWYVHPDDRAAHAQAQAPSPMAQRLLRRRRMWNIFRLVMLPFVFVLFALQAMKVFQ